MYYGVKETNQDFKYGVEDAYDGCLLKNGDLKEANEQKQKWNADQSSE
jgi:hypothetical protein